MELGWGDKYQELFKTAQFNYASDYVTFNEKIGHAP
jgi:hypothetical protein